MHTANDIHELVAPYALDALDAEERAEFERHLADCEPLLTRAAELQDTAASLAWGVEGPEPPTACGAGSSSRRARRPRSSASGPGAAG